MPKISKKTRLLIMIGLTLGFFFAEIVVGEASRSNSLKADAFHMYGSSPQRQVKISENYAAASALVFTFPLLFIYYLPIR